VFFAFPDEYFVRLFSAMPSLQLGLRDHPKCFHDLRQPLVFLAHPRLITLKAHQSVSRPKTYEKKQDESGRVSNHDISNHDKGDFQ
jgi:hypothetical protein